MRKPRFKPKPAPCTANTARTRTSPLFALYETLKATAFEKHTYGHTTMGYERDIAAMPTLYDYSREFFARYYRPENTVLFVAGDVEPAGRDLARREVLFGTGSAATCRRAFRQNRSSAASGTSRSVTTDGRCRSSAVAYKLPAFDPADPVRVAADLLVDLAFGETSDAYQAPRARRAESSSSSTQPPAAIAIRRCSTYTARVKDPAKIDYVLGVIDQTVAEYRTAPPDPDRLAALQPRLHYGFLMSLQTPDRVAARLAPFIALSGNLEGVRELYATYAAVRPEDVQAAAERYFDAERRTVAVLRGQQ